MIAMQKPAPTPNNPFGVEMPEPASPKAPPIPPAAPSAPLFPMPGRPYPGPGDLNPRR